MCAALYYPDQKIACRREAQLEKKAARREAAKEREQSPDISKLPGGGDIMGGGDSFAAAKARYHTFETSMSSLPEAPSVNWAEQKSSCADAQHCCFVQTQLVIFIAGFFACAIVYGG